MFVTKRSTKELIRDFALSCLISSFIFFRLRNMKSDSSLLSGGMVMAPTIAATIKMAEFRYGREEMLALFDRNVTPPDPLKQIQGLFVDKTQFPLALVQMTDEETVSLIIFHFQYQVLELSYLVPAQKTSLEEAKKSLQKSSTWVKLVGKAYEPLRLFGIM